MQTRGWVFRSCRQPRNTHPTASAQLSHPFTGDPALPQTEDFGFRHTTSGPPVPGSGGAEVSVVGCQHCRCPPTHDATVLQLCSWRHSPQPATIDSAPTAAPSKLQGNSTSRVIPGKERCWLAPTHRGKSPLAEENPSLVASARKNTKFQCFPRVLPPENRGDPVVIQISRLAGDHQFKPEPRGAKKVDNFPKCAQR